MLNPNSLKDESTISSIGYFYCPLNDDIFTADSLVSDLTPDEHHIKLDSGLHSQDYIYQAPDSVFHESTSSSNDDDFIQSLYNSFQKLAHTLNSLPTWIQKYQNSLAYGRYEQQELMQVIEGSQHLLGQMGQQIAHRNQQNQEDTYSLSGWKFQETKPFTDSSSVAVGQEFNSLKEAEETIKSYAIQSGFAVCRGNSIKNLSQDFACTCRGRARSRNTQDWQRQRRRESRKSDCKCIFQLRYCKEAQKWIMKRTHLLHNHSLLSPNQILKLPNNRYIPERVKRQALRLLRDNLTPAKINRKLEREEGPNCTWTQKDMYNFLYRYKKDNLGIKDEE